MLSVSMTALTGAFPDDFPVGRCDEWLVSVYADTVSNIKICEEWNREVVAEGQGMAREDLCSSAWCRVIAD